jgi:hypothetical protein
MDATERVTHKMGVDIPSQPKESVVRGLAALRKGDGLICRDAQSVCEAADRFSLRKIRQCLIFLPGRLIHMLTT